MRAAGGLRRAHLGASAQGAVGRRGFCRQGSGRQTPGWEQAWEALTGGPVTPPAPAPSRAAPPQRATPGLSGRPGLGVGRPAASRQEEQRGPGGVAAL